MIESDAEIRIEYGISAWRFMPLRHSTKVMRLPFLPERR
jgi:hypothetical protein